MNIPQSLAFLESVLAHGPVGYAFVDDRLRFAEVNTRLAEINGLPAAEHLGRTVSEVLGPALWVSRQRLFERALAGEDIVDFRLPGLNQEPDETSNSVLASYYPVWAGETIIGVAVIVRDITEQENAKAALAVREQEYRLIFDANPQPMWVYDIETLRFLDVNAAAIRVYGYSRDEFLARTLADIRPQGDVDAMMASVHLARTGALIDGPWNHIRKDGSSLWVEIASNSLEFQGRHARLILATDVTDRQNMEQERRETTQRQQTFLRDVLASVTEGKLQLCGSLDQLPSQLDMVGGAVPLTPAAGLYDLRHLAQALAAQAGHDGLRQYDLMTAASEAGMNAIVHGGGGTAKVSVNARGTVQVRVEDQGSGITMENLPRATLSRGFSTKASLGHGLKMMLETADRLFLLTGPTGTTLVLEQDSVAPTPAWL